MKRTKPILAILVCMAMTLALFPSFTAFAETYSGTCGDSVTWELDTSTGVLTISGTGDMWDYSRPWIDYRDSITSVVIEDGVTRIGGSAFNACEYLTSISIPASITSVGSNAFLFCNALKDVFITDLTAWCNIEFSGNSSSPMYYADNFYIDDVLTTEIVIPNGITEIKDYTFYGFADLVYVTLPDEVTSIGNNAFSNCSSLASISIPDSVTSIGYRAFRNCEALTDVYYNGSEEDWANISIDEDNTYLTDAAIHYNCVAMPTEVTLPAVGAYENAAEATVSVTETGGVTVNLTITDESALSASNVTAYAVSY